MGSLGAWALAASAFAFALYPFAGAAELLRCKGPDGKTIYTDKKSVCPEAETYEPKAVLHGVETQEPAAVDEEGGGDAGDARMRTLRRMRVDEARSDEAARWQALKRQKEGELQDVTAQRKRLVDFVSWCNRGGSVITRDDAGIAQGVKCNELNDRLAALDEKAASIRNYIDNELPEECRRAGCLPGWIR